jgi:predicted transposase/invertase (TIGR01784 family)
MSQEGEISAILNTFIRYLESAALQEIRVALIEKITAWLKDGDVKMSSIIDEITKDAVSKAVSKAVSEAVSEATIKATIKATSEDAQKMLQKGMSVEVVQEITGLTSKQLDMLQRKTEGHDS